MRELPTGPQSLAKILDILVLPRVIPVRLDATPSNTRQDVVQQPKRFLRHAVDVVAPIPAIHSNQMSVEPQALLDGCRPLRPSTESLQELRTLLREHWPVEEPNGVPANAEHPVDVVSIADHLGYTVLSWVTTNALFAIVRYTRPNH